MGCKKNMIKLLLVVFNVIAVIIGLALLGIGAYSKIEYGDILSVSESSFTSIPTMMMILGVLVFILGFLGCFGSFKENRACLIIYTILLVIVLMGELVAIIITVIYNGKIKEQVQDGLEDKVASYIAYDNDNKKGDKKDKEIVDDIQASLKCCGTHGTNSYLDNETWSTAHKTKIPASCCIPDKTEGEYCETTGNDANIYKEGCVDLATDALSDNAGLVIGIACAFVFIQIIGVCLGCVLCQRIARDGYKEV